MEDSVVSVLGIIILSNDCPIHCGFNSSATIILSVRLSIVINELQSNRDANKLSLYICSSIVFSSLIVIYGLLLNMIVT